MVKGSQTAHSHCAHGRARLYALMIVYTYTRSFGLVSRLRWFSFKATPLLRAELLRLTRAIPKLVCGIEVIF